MTACPDCHIFKGLWSPMTRNDKGLFICKADGAHRYTRDREGNFHTVK